MLFPVMQFLENISSFNIIYVSQALISIDPVRARDDPVIVKNIPYYKAKKALEAEVTRLDPPPRPPNWGVRILYFHFMYAISCFLNICLHFNLIINLGLIGNN